MFEEFIKFIQFSAGDPRRPYPTDFEMRHGFLGKIGDQPINPQLLQSQGSYGEPMTSNRTSAASLGKYIIYKGNLLQFLDWDKEIPMMWSDA